MTLLYTKLKVSNNYYSSVFLLKISKRPIYNNYSNLNLENLNNNHKYYIIYYT